MYISTGVDADVINSIADGGVGSKGGESSSRARNSSGSDVVTGVPLLDRATRNTLNRMYIRRVYE